MIKTPNVGTNTEENQRLNSNLNYIIVELDYEHKVIFSISDGLKYVELMANGVHVSKPYNKPMKFLEKPAKLELEFASEQEVRELRLTAMIDDNGE